MSEETTHEITEGEWLLKIAHENGFRSEESLWEANPELKQLTINPNVLPGGYRLRIPSFRVSALPATTEKVNRFIASTPSVLLRIEVSFLADVEDARGAEVRRIGQNEALTGEGRDALIHYRLQTGKYTPVTAEPPVDPLPADRNLGRAPVRFTAFRQEGMPDDPGTVVLDIHVLHPVNGVGSWHQQQRVRVSVGGLEPLRGPRGPHALQKILSNLGYYAGRIDGVIGPKTRAALCHFQEQEGVRYPGDGSADRDTCAALAARVGPQVSFDGVERTQYYAPSRDAPLVQYVNATRQDAANVFHNSYYNEPSWTSRTLRQKCGDFEILNPRAFVAPAPRSSAPGTGIPTILRNRKRQFVFLDVGRWVRSARDFGIVWGRHAYLCEYHHLPGIPLIVGTPPDRLDQLFLDAMGARVKVRQRATASWAPEDELDWNSLYLILPDLHLLTEPVERYWRGQSNYLGAELDLLHFADDVLRIQELKGKIRVIQVGDSYDLWVSRGECLFVDSPAQDVVLRTPPQMATLDPKVIHQHEAQTSWPLDPVKTLGSWVRELQGWVGPNDAYHDGKAYQMVPRRQNWVLDVFEERFRQGIDKQADFAAHGSRFRMKHSYGVGYQLWLNPAEAAFRTLEKGLGDDMIYLWGNHDNYLSLPGVQQDAGLRPRRLYFQSLGLHVEHAHRLESLFTFGANYDGTTSGHATTHEVFKARCGDPSYYNTALRVIRTLFPVAGSFISPADLANFADELSEVWAGFHDQYGYWSEFARLRVARELNREGPIPHICVIGHTHRPRIEYIDINRDA